MNTKNAERKTKKRTEKGPELKVKRGRELVLRFRFDSPGDTSELVTHLWRRTFEQLSPEAIASVAKTLGEQMERSIAQWLNGEDNADVLMATAEAKPVPAQQ